MSSLIVIILNKTLGQAILKGNLLYVFILWLFNWLFKPTMIKYIFLIEVYFELYYQFFDGPFENKGFLECR